MQCTAHPQRSIVRYRFDTSFENTAERRGCLLTPRISLTLHPAVARWMRKSQSDIYVENTTIDVLWIIAEATRCFAIEEVARCLGLNRRNIVSSPPQKQAKGQGRGNNRYNYTETGAGFHIYANPQSGHFSRQVLSTGNRMNTRLEILRVTANTFQWLVARIQCTRWYFQTGVKT